ncbi:transketolase [Candidatus Giovannonibacteria bacterium RIFCSPLOWO2_01_FULL_46_13]|uniref:Transketolase n=1 Tax=Candidatus Giovannonibacteria bacterium RIFCSPLOWO2_01_FULL_46_13 TaxID=1798352 RepID=A0A1F5X4C5_9BACT|nr:MAG: transketolase [Candidatus Giovannonibacteria bacterium RIFCSPLOWO2_01_FULL_46_13]
MEQKPTRDGYGQGLLEAGDRDERVVALCADLTESTRTEEFAKKYPKRFIEMGVAEQNLAALASGLANYGKIPFITSYAMFSPGRNWEQIRTTICYNNVPVKIIGSHAGVSVGPDGATHQAIEDMAIMRVIPNMTVLAPCDMHEGKKATLAALELDGPVYIRFARDKSPVFTTPETPFKIGKAEIFFESENPKVAIVGCGPLVHNAILAAADLEKEGIGVIVVNNPSVKPLDEKLIIEVAKNAGAVVTVEEHQVSGGMGSAVAEALAKNYPVPMEFVGVQNRFGESGPPSVLVENLGMGKKSIIEAVKKVLGRK